ncbi:uncharacterized protein LOC130799538 isoform X2 [Amaranthus tricolor]|uniref:uncharacterized protein LOC130799538 isoform X2 n=1 Tax=Amaranthus tricolor TaxID=29722 RepID=UPI0025846067|nr:uncharacterized protein LOC130799538 isoform X2 [Amaranthus tricolor]
MFRQSDLDLNLVYNFGDPLKETLKQTMLNQELHFKLQHSVLAIMQKPLELQLPADEYINQCVEGNVVVTSCLQESIQSRNSSQDKLGFCLEYPNLSLSIGRDACKINKEHISSWKGKNNFSSSFDIIDLEDANSSFPYYNANLGFTSSSATTSSCSRDKHKIDCFLKRGRQKLESFPQIDIWNGSYQYKPSKSFVDVDPSCQTRSLCDSGIYGHYKNFFLANHLSENKKFACKVNNWDLNVVQLEDPSYFSNDSMVMNSSITSLLPVLDRVCPKSKVSSFVDPASSREFTKMHKIHYQKEAGSRVYEGKMCYKEGKVVVGNGADISFVDLDSDSCEDLCSNRSDPNISSVGSLSKISNGLSCKMEVMDAVRVEANLDKSVEPFDQPNCSKLISSSESECMVDNHSSSTKTMQSCAGCDDIVAPYSGKDLRSSVSTESNIQCASRKKPEEVDGIVQTAAKLLVQMATEAETCCEDEMSRLASEKVQNQENELLIVEEDQPQCSSDSYEAIILKTDETSPNEYCSSSNALLVDESEKKDLKYKLKRGTRMRDFQKDILPSLSTLSRHEIREDVSIFEGIIRSREYKRIRAKMADKEGNWCTSTRNTRSRLNRRYYL